MYSHDNCIINGSFHDDGYSFRDETIATVCFYVCEFCISYLVNDLGRKGLEILYCRK